jgi:hypothetical protein
MMWVFSRGSAQVDIEVRRGGEPSTYELVVDYPDGSERVVRFTDARKLLRQALRVQQDLIRRGWTPLPADRASRRRRASPAPRTARRRLWSRIQQRLSARFAATFGF